MKNYYEKEKNRFLLPLLIIIVIFIISVALVEKYFIYIRTLTTDNTFKNLAELTKVDTSKLKNTIEEHERILETIVNEVEVNNPRTEDDIFQIFLRNSGNIEFSRIAILYEDGRTSTSDGEIVDLSDEVEEFFKTNEIQISKSRKSKVDEQEINVYSEKTNWNNQNIVILLVVETNKFEEIFSQSMYNGNGAEYIITDDGQIIANSRNEQNGNNIFEKLKYNSKNQTDNNNNSLEYLKQQILNEQDGQINYEIRGKNYYISCQDLEINDWNLLIITSGNAIAEDLNQLLNITFIISIVVIVIIIIISAYIVISNAIKRRNLYKLAYIDDVTKLGNYNYFKEVGQEFILSSKDVYLIVLDIDKFKSFNKKYGHELGSKLLYQIGKILGEILGKNTVICRLENDTFAVLFITKRDIIKEIEKIEKSLEKIKIDGKEYKVYFSIGIYKLKHTDKDIIKVLDKALIPHAEAKGNYDIQYKIFDEKIEEKIEKEHEIELVMEEALNNKEFEVYYQPKVSTVNGKVEAAEALVRWKRDGKLISPGDFIPVFEKNQFIIKLDTYIFENVCKDLSDWKNKYGKIPLVSINVSKEHFVKDKFIDEYVDIANKYNLKPNEIEIEITESASVNEEIDIINVMKKIKEAGFEISIDDFGTGYSSLSMLQNMPIDTIKIDKSFIDKIVSENQENDIVEFIILMSKKMHLKIVAEGVETVEQVKYLKKLKCDLIQGYYYSKPLTKIDFEKYMQESK